MRDLGRLSIRTSKGGGRFCGQKYMIYNDTIKGGAHVSGILARTCKYKR